METLARAFELESYRIDQLIWDAMALRAGETVLFCGFANNIDWIKRAIDVGVRVSVISDDSAAMRDFDGLKVEMLRGSTSMLPARDASFDATIAFHYLHEIDPFFHANVVSELGRVGKRCMIVEPAPPSDPLGLRIASLYSRAKRELGQFELYHHIDYWRKLLSIVKPDVRAQTFQFMRTPPREAIRDTVALIIDTMAAQATPEPYLAELRALAARPDAHLLPQARYVIVGASPNVAVNDAAGTEFRAAAVVRSVQAATPFVAPQISAEGSRDATTPAIPSTVYSSDLTPEFPAVEPPAARSAIPDEPGAAARIARNAFGLAQAPPATPRIESVFEDTDGTDGFGITAQAAGDMPDFGWQWEPPDDKDAEKKAP